MADAQWSPSERDVLARYLWRLRDLAGTEVLTAPQGYSVQLAALDSEPEIVTTAPRRDSMVGFLTMLRQCYARKEEASFDRAYGLVAREVNRVRGASPTLKAWRQAHATLRANHLDHLILVVAAADGHVPEHLAERNASHPSQNSSPNEMIAAMFYGDTIHWGDGRRIIDDWNSEHAAIALKRKLDAVRATVYLAHLYVGFAGLVAIASGESPTSAASHLRS